MDLLTAYFLFLVHLERTIYYFFVYIFGLIVIVCWFYSFLFRLKAQKHAGKKIFCPDKTRKMPRKVSEDA